MLYAHRETDSAGPCPMLGDSKGSYVPADHKRPYSQRAASKMMLGSDGSLLCLAKSQKGWAVSLAQISVICLQSASPCTSCSVESCIVISQNEERN